MLKLTFVDI